MKKYLIFIYILTSASFYFSCDKKQKNELQVNDSARILPKARINYDSMGASTLGTTGTIFSTTGSTTTSKEDPNLVPPGSTTFSYPNVDQYPNTPSKKNHSK